MKNKKKAEGETEWFRGKLWQIKFRKPGFAIGTFIKQDGSGEITLIGDLPDADLYEPLDVMGEWTESKWGKQFKVHMYSRPVPSDPKGIANYLEQEVAGVGPKRAKLLLDTFGDDLKDVLDNHPERLSEAKISPQTANRISSAWKKENIQRQLCIFLAQYGIHKAWAPRVIEVFGGYSIDELKANPYRLTQVYGIDFKRADAMAKKMGWPKNSPECLEAVLVNLVDKASEQGHVFLPEDLLVEQALRKVDALPSEVRDALERVVNRAELVREAVKILDGVNLIYLPHLNKAEEALAMGIKEHITAPNDIGMDLRRGIADIKIAELKGKVQSKLDVILTAQQWQAVKAAISEPVSILTGGPGTGKCLAPETSVLMYDGTTKMAADIRTGDLLMGPDSKPRTVLGWTKGAGQMYLVTPAKGTSYKVNAPHILSLKMSRYENGKAGDKRKYRGGEIVNIPVEEFITRSKKFRHHAKGWRTGVEFHKKEVFLEPRFLGLWLGDGASANQKISSVDIPVRDYLQQYADRLGMSLPNNVSDTERCPVWSITYGLPKPGEKVGTTLNPIVIALRSLGLINNKHIPDIYKINSRRVRLELLAGLIDSDGSGTQGYDFTSEDERLTDDVVFLARSLGFAAYKKPCTKKCQTGAVGDYYRVFISGDLTEVPVLLNRKKQKPRKQKKDVLRVGIKVEDAGWGEYAGFELSGDGLFLLGDFTVTHNTTTLKALTEMANLLGAKLMLAAPTGRAAKRMSEVSGQQAKTIHRLLEFQPQSNTFNRNKGNPLEADIVAIDETSMVDLCLAKALFDAIGPKTTVVLIGDPDQLPSVGPGKVLEDLVNLAESGRMPISHEKLTKIFRQAEDSLIVRNAHGVTHGQTPLFPPASSGNKADSHMVETKGDPQKTLDVVKELCTEKIPKEFGIGTKDIQVIVPMKMGACGVHTLNNALQAAINPKGEPINLLRNLRVGDKVMQLRNNYNADLFNGDIGTIEGADEEDKMLVIDFYGRKIAYPFEDAEDLILAYATTVHKSAGSEYPACVIVLLRKHYVLLKKPLLYTALTRAKKLVFVVGDKAAIRIAVRNSEDSRRYSLLVRRLSS